MNSVSRDLAKTVEIDALRFQDKDLSLVGTLEFGQYGVVSHDVLKSFGALKYRNKIDVVTCRLNGINYVRKSVEKRFALRARDVGLLFLYSSHLQLI